MTGSPLYEWTSTDSRIGDTTSHDSNCVNGSMTDRQNFVQLLLRTKPEVDFGHNLFVETFLAEGLTLKVTTVCIKKGN